MRLNKKILKILAIETSCDETAAAVIEVRGSSNQLSVISKNTDNRLPITDNLDIKILSNVVASQIKIHQQYGGVFPELASRAHTEKIIPVVEEALAQSNSYPLSVIGRKNTDNQLPITNLLNTIDLIAVTAGPGLIGSLMVGVNAAKTLSYVTKKPIISINHWLGHIYSNFVGEKFKIQNANLKMTVQNLKLPEFPALILIVSGGHTGLVLMESHKKIKTIGQTLDDAAGEAFDKVAKLLGLGYPGGPAISAAAEKCKMQNANLKMIMQNLKYKCRGNTPSEMPVSAALRNPAARREELRKQLNRMARAAESEGYAEAINNIKFPRSMLNRKDLNFSFSGLKTAVLYKVREIEKVIRSDSGVIHRDLLSEKKSRGEAANHHQLPNHSFFSPQPTTIAHRPSPLITQPPNHHQSRAAGANHLITCRQALITQSPLYQSLIAHEFQQTVIDILIGKTLQAARKYHPKSICLCGGVSANQELREQMAQQITQSLNHNKSPNHLITFHVPPLSLTTDNAAMIGIAAAYHLDQQTTWDKIKADANMEL